MTAHTTDISVRFADLDPYGHVNHAMYVTYLEVARTEALSEIGLALQDLMADGYQIVVVDLSIKYLRSATLGDVVTVDTRVDEIRGASSRWSQRIRRGEDVIVTAELRFGFTRTDGRPTRMPDDLKGRLATLSG
jgi:acyl-CoA thioester hydrolase